ncbi:hypothetical protein ACU4GA_16875 [Methylobacterium oryzae CBMB20]
MLSTTGPALNVFLQSHHDRMPSLRLDRRRDGRGHRLHLEPQGRGAE